MKITYETPFGTFGDWISAAERCEASDLDPITSIKIVRD